MDLITYRSVNANTNIDITYERERKRGDLRTCDPRKKKKTKNST